MTNVLPLSREAPDSFERRCIGRVFYVYGLYRPSGEPFYIGKGMESRWAIHEWKARRGVRSHVCNVIRKIWHDGGEVRRVKLRDGLTNDEAIALECEMIAKHGRIETGGLLTNKTVGGEGAAGWRHTPTSLAKMRRAWRTRAPASLETRRRIGEAQRGKKLSETQRQKLSLANSGERHWNFGKRITPDHAAKLRASVQKRVVANGIEYASIAEAAKAVGIVHSAMHYRVNAKTFEGFHYV